MARPNQRRKTQVQQVDTSGTQAPALQVAGRSLNVGGFDRNVKAARALEQAFSTGSKFVAQEQTRRNADGRTQAITERGTGATQDEDNKQAGYMRAWDELDAEFDFNLMKQELPEQLRGFDAESKSEEEVQDFISTYMRDQVGGIESQGDSAYAEFLGPKLLELETSIISEHRQVQLDGIREEQRSKVYSTARDALVSARQVDPASTVDYNTLFVRTGEFFDGKEKKSVFWESLYDLAIETGDSSIIDNVPKNINGVPTGINDPALLDSHRAASASADGVAARNLKVQDAEIKQTNVDAVFSTQLQIVEMAERGEDTSALVESLRANPESTFSDWTAAQNFGTSLRDDAESRSADLNVTAELWTRIHSGTASPTDVMTALEDGALGAGEGSVNEYRLMLSTINANKETDVKGQGPATGAFRSELNDRYNPATQGMMAALDSSMLHIRNSAMQAYNQKVLVEGLDPAVAAQQVKEQFDPLVSTNTSMHSSQADVEVEMGMITADSFREVANGSTTAVNAFSGMTSSSVEARLFDLLASGELSDAEAEAVIAATVN